MKVSFILTLGSITKIKILPSDIFQLNKIPKILIGSFQRGIFLIEGSNHVELFPSKSLYVDTNTFCCFGRYIIGKSKDNQFTIIKMHKKITLANILFKKYEKTNLEINGEIKNILKVNEQNILIQSSTDIYSLNLNQNKMKRIKISGNNIQDNQYFMRNSIILSNNLLAGWKAYHENGNIKKKYFCLFVLKKLRALNVLKKEINCQ